VINFVETGEIPVFEDEEISRIEESFDKEIEEIRFE
jgi:hypothetical protein